jgi:hypothetical protein
MGWTRGGYLVGIRPRDVRRRRRRRNTGVSVTDCKIAFFLFSRPRTRKAFYLQKTVPFVLVFVACKKSKKVSGVLVSLLAASEYFLYH